MGKIHKSNASVSSVQFPDLDYGILHDLVGHLLRHASNKAQLSFTETFKGINLTSLQFMIMELVRCNPGVTHNQISSAMGTAPSVVTTTLKPLLEQNFIQSKTSQTDGRKRIYTLSSEGHQWFMATRSAINTSEKELTKALTPEELDQFVKSLKKIIDQPQPN